MHEIPLSFLSSKRTKPRRLDETNARKAMYAARLDMVHHDVVKGAAVRPISSAALTARQRPSSWLLIILHWFDQLHTVTIDKPARQRTDGRYLIASGACSLSLLAKDSSTWVAIDSWATHNLCMCSPMFEQAVIYGGKKQEGYQRAPAGPSPMNKPPLRNEVQQAL